MAGRRLGATQGLSEDGDKPPNPPLMGPEVWRLLFTRLWPAPHLSQDAPGGGQGFVCLGTRRPRERGLRLWKAEWADPFGLGS